MCTQVPLERIVRGVEYKEMCGLLADFRRYIEKDAETPIERLEVNAALVLHDLCSFTGMNEAHRQTVLGKSACAFIAQELDARVSLKAVH